MPRKGPALPLLQLAYDGKTSAAALTRARTRIEQEAILAVVGAVC